MVEDPTVIMSSVTDLSGSGVVSYRSRPSGGAGDSFTSSPALTSTIFRPFIVERQRVCLLYLVIPQHSKTTMLFSGTKAFSFTGTQHLKLEYGYGFLLSKYLVSYLFFGHQHFNI